MRGSPCTTARLEQQKPIVANFILGPHRFDAEMQQTAFSWLKGIYYNALAPGYFRTELNKALVEDEKFSAWLSARTPLGRWGDVQEFVGAAIFLASDASSFRQRARTVRSRL